MARYMLAFASLRFVAVDLEMQLVPSSFEQTLYYLLQHEIDLSGSAERYRNELTGAAAYPLALLRKVILCAYAGHTHFDCSVRRDGPALHDAGRFLLDAGHSSCPADCLNALSL